MAGFGNCGTAIFGLNGLTPGTKPGGCGGVRSPFGIPDKIKKNVQINIEPHINTMQYIKEIYIKCAKIYMSQVNLNILHHFALKLIKCTNVS